MSLYIPRHISLRYMALHLPRADGVIAAAVSTLPLHKDPTCWRAGLPSVIRQQRSVCSHRLPCKARSTKFASPITAFWAEASEHTSPAGPAPTVQPRDTFAQQGSDPGKLAAGATQALEPMPAPTRPDATATITLTPKDPQQLSQTGDRSAALNQKPPGAAAPSQIDVSFQPAASAPAASGTSAPRQQKTGDPCRPVSGHFCGGDACLASYAVCIPVAQHLQTVRRVARPHADSADPVSSKIWVLLQRPPLHLSLPPALPSASAQSQPARLSRQMLKVRRSPRACCSVPGLHWCLPPRPVLLSRHPP